MRFYLLPLLALAIPLVANPYTQFIVNLMLVYVLVAVGFNLVLGNLGQLAFANTALFGIGAYTARDADGARGMAVLGGDPARRGSPARRPGSSRA